MLFRSIMANPVKEFQVAPQSTAGEKLLPLTFFDIPWTLFHPIHRLFFYEIPSCSKTYFMDSILPTLHDSLSLTLKHYLPLAGKLIIPLSSAENPVLRYLPGDCVSLTSIESEKDFNALVESSPRDCDQFYDFIPELPPVSEESGCKALQVLAVKVTLFPNRGICIGVANHHSAGDATSIVGFLKLWASIGKLGGDSMVESLPNFDRSLIKDSGDWVSKLCPLMRYFPFQSVVFPVPTNRVRSTHTLTLSDIKKLKDLILAKSPNFVHLSSFVASIAYIWSCLVKSNVLHDDLKEEPEEVPGDEPEYFLFAADCRSRLDPPLPENYFGNCLSFGIAKIPHKEIVGDEGFLAAAEAIADQIKNRVNNKEKIAEGPIWIQELYSVPGNRMLSVSGSARVDVYGLDFGFGRPRKLETLSIDRKKYSISLCRSSSGGLEFGMSLPPARMTAFSIIFHARKGVRVNSLFNITDKLM